MARGAKAAGVGGGAACAEDAGRTLVIPVPLEEVAGTAEAIADAVQWAVPGATVLIGGALAATGCAVSLVCPVTIALGAVLVGVILYAVATMPPSVAAPVAAPPVAAPTPARPMPQPRPTPVPSPPPTPQTGPTARPTVPPPLPLPTPTAGRRPAMRVQLQQQDGGAGTIHHQAIQLFAPDSNGVITTQVIEALHTLRANRVIPRRQQTNADAALADAIRWTQTRPPYGVSEQNFSQSSYFEPRDQRYSWRFDIENLVGTNLRR